MGTKRKRDTDEFLYEDDSDNPLAGRGLFTKKFILKGTVIGNYKTESKEIDYDVWENEEAGESHDSAYVAQFEEGGNYYDGENTLLGLINAGPNYNVEFKENGDVVTVQDIAPNTELLFDYGEDYWVKGREEVGDKIEKLFGGEMFGVPVYFPAMLMDQDRNYKYKLAIQETIQRFTDEQGRRPDVLDVGCGTGFLTLCSIFSNANTVNAFDANTSMAGHLAPLALQNTLDDYGIKFSRKDFDNKTSFWIKEFDNKNGFSSNGCRVTFHCGRFIADVQLPVIEKKYDLLVTEMFGTLAQSEDVVTILQQILLAVEKFNGKRYTVPKDATSYVSVYTGIRGMSQWRASLEWTPTCKYPEIDFSSAYRNKSVIYRIDTLDVLEEETESGPTEYFSEKFECTRGQYLVLEWKSQLSDSYVLYNTVEESKSMLPFDPTNMAARNEAWGFFAIYCANKRRRSDSVIRVHVRRPQRQRNDRPQSQRNDRPPFVSMNGYPIRLTKFREGEDVELDFESTFHKKEYFSYDEVAESNPFPHTFGVITGFRQDFLIEPFMQDLTFAS